MNDVLLNYVYSKFLALYKNNNNKTTNHLQTHTHHYCLSDLIARDACTIFFCIVTCRHANPFKYMLLCSELGSWCYERSYWVMKYTIFIKFMLRAECGKPGRKLHNFALFGTQRDRWRR